MQQLRPDYRIAKQLGKLQKVYQDFFLRLLPDRSLPSAELSWPDYRASFKKRHVLVCILLVAIVIGLWYLVAKIPFMQYSILTGTSSGVNFLLGLAVHRRLHLERYLLYAEVFLLLTYKDYILSVIGNPLFVGRNLPKFAMREEILFRAGCENWTLVQKVKSCISFGLIHLSMLIVPLGASLALCAGGAGLMICYLYYFKRTKSQQAALVGSAVIHTTYNLTICGMLVLSIITTLLVIITLAVKLLLRF